MDESHVLVQPADAVYCEVGHQDGQEIEGSDDTLFESEKSESLSMKVQISDNMNEGGLVSSGSGSAVEEGDTSVKNKKFKQSENVASGNSEHQTSSPELPHKLPARSRQEVITSDEGSDENMEGVHTNMFGVKYGMWFDVSIEGKSAMDREEEDWGGKLEFGFSDNSFPKDIEDYFLLMEDECSTHSHNCGGRVSGVVFNMRNSVLKPPSYDPRNIVDLVDKYSDAHIIDSGWREVDTEEWVT